jgi:hypothetical protein
MHARVGKLVQQLLKDLGEDLRIEHLHGFGERSRGRLAATLLPAAGALEITQGFQRGNEEHEEDQAAEMIKKEFPIASPVPLHARVSQMRQERLQPFQELDPMERFSRVRTKRFVRHRSDLSD